MLYLTRFRILSMNSVAILVIIINIYFSYKGFNNINFFNKYKFNQEIRWTKSINTNKKKEILWSDIRKSYKSPINKGLKEQTFQLIDYLNLDHDKFKSIQDLHFKISGRKTR